MRVRVEPSISAERAERRAATVLQVLPTLEPGPFERTAVEVAAGLGRIGWRAIVASAGGPMEYELDRAGAEHAYLPLDQRGPLAIGRNANRLARLIEAQGVDLVHAQGVRPARSALAAARRTGRPFVTTCTALPRSPLRQWQSTVLTKGDVVIAGSAAVAGELRRDFGLDGHRLATIPRGIDAELFDPARVSPQRVVQLSRAWRLGDGVNVMLLPAEGGRLAGQKLLLAALGRLGRDDLTAILLGLDEADEGRQDEIEYFVHRRRLGIRLRLPADCRDMPAAYMLADVVVAPSVPADGFSPDIAEALAMGRPVVAIARGGGAGMIRHGETGWLVRPGAPGELMTALSEAVGLSAARRAALAAAARRDIERHFSLAEMQARTIEVYEGLLSRWR